LLCIFQFVFKFKFQSFLPIEISPEESFVIEAFLIQPVDEVDQVTFLLSDPKSVTKIHLIDFPQQLPHRIIETSSVPFNYILKVLLLQRFLDLLLHLLNVSFPLRDYTSSLWIAWHLPNKEKNTGSK
jgi:hypothetical protein